MIILDAEISDLGNLRPVCGRTMDPCPSGRMVLQDSATASRNCPSNLEPSRTNLPIQSRMIELLSIPHLSQKEKKKREQWLLHSFIIRAAMMINDLDAESRRHLWCLMETIQSDSGLTSACRRSSVPVVAVTVQHFGSRQDVSRIAFGYQYSTSLALDKAPEGWRSCIVAGVDWGSNAPFSCWLISNLTCKLTGTDRRIRSPFPSDAGGRRLSDENEILQAGVFDDPSRRTYFHFAVLQRGLVADVFLLHCESSTRKN